MKYQKTADVIDELQPEDIEYFNTTEKTFPVCASVYQSDLMKGSVLQALEQLDELNDLYVGDQQEDCESSIASATGTEADVRKVSATGAAAG